MKRVILTLGPGQQYAMVGDKVKSGESFHLTVEVMRSIPAYPGGPNQLSPWRLVDQEVTKAAQKEAR